MKAIIFYTFTVQAKRVNAKHLVSFLGAIDAFSCPTCSCLLQSRNDQRRTSCSRNYLAIGKAFYLQSPAEISAVCCDISNVHHCRQFISRKHTVNVLLPEIVVPIICGTASHATRFGRYPFGLYSEETVFYECYARRFSLNVIQVSNEQETRRRLACRLPAESPAACLIGTSMRLLRKCA